MCVVVVHVIRWYWFWSLVGESIYIWILFWCLHGISHKVDINWFMLIYFVKCSNIQLLVTAIKYIPQVSLWYFFAIFVLEVLNNLRLSVWFNVREVTVVMLESAETMTRYQVDVMLIESSMHLKQVLSSPLENHQSPRSQLKYLSCFFRYTLTSQGRVQ